MISPVCVFSCSCILKYLLKLSKGFPIYALYVYEFNVNQSVVVFNVCMIFIRVIDFASDVACLQPKTF